MTFGLIVTGEGEQEFLPTFFRSIMLNGNCTFKVLRRVPQRSPIMSKKRTLRMVGSGKTIPDRDQEEIGLPARRFLGANQDSCLILIDDLENDRREMHAAIFDRYSRTFDTFLSPELRSRASVHFLVNMIEAYYFADPAAVNTVLKTQLTDCVSDVEQIRHPKNDLKRLSDIPFDEKAHGCEIVKLLDLEKVLSNPEWCRSLRTLVKWCVAVLREPYADRFRLLDGNCCIVTEGQLSSLG